MLQNKKFTVSKRCQEYTSQHYPLSVGMNKYMENPYSESNPSGIINLGTAENTLQIDHLNSKLKKSTALELREEDVKYNGFVGTDDLRSKLAAFLNHQHQLESNLIQKDDISVHNGCGSVLELLGYVLCDPNDAIIVPSPYYSGFDKDLQQRPQVQLIHAPSLHPELKVELTQIELAYHQNHDKHNIKAVLLMNPVNPTGEMMELSTIESISNFCMEKGLHLIVDEIYSFTNLSNTPFKTAWTLNQPHIHLVWGFSKDFCINGFRTGMLITKNKQILQGFMELSYFYMVPTVVQNILAQVVEDLDFCEQYLNSNNFKLRLNLELVQDCFRAFNADLGNDASKYEITFVMPDGGYFIYCNFSKFLKSRTTEHEYELWNEFLAAGVYFALGDAFHGPVGWFRICFAVVKALLQLALERMLSVLKKRIN